MNTLQTNYKICNFALIVSLHYLVKLKTDAFEVHQCSAWKDLEQHISNY